MFAALLPILGGIFGQITKSIFPDPADELKRMELQQQLQLALLQQSAAIEAASADIVKTEAASSHWLAANWRPMLMVFFAGLIGARWFGWSAQGISETEYLKLWDIVQLGLGGYVIGRSAEKTLPGVVAAMRGK
jgi:hypothetical protein